MVVWGRQERVGSRSLLTLFLDPVRLPGPAGCSQTSAMNEGWVRPVRGRPGGGTHLQVGALTALVLARALRGAQCPCTCPPSLHCSGSGAPLLQCPCCGHGPCGALLLLLGLSPTAIWLCLRVCSSSSSPALTVPLTSGLHVMCPLLPRDGGAGHIILCSSGSGASRHPPRVQTMLSPQ